MIPQPPHIGAPAAHVPAASPGMVPQPPHLGGGAAPAPAPGVPAATPFSPWVQQAIASQVAGIGSQIAGVNAQSAADIAKSQATQQSVSANLGALATSGDNAAAQFAARAAAAQGGSDASAAQQTDYLNRLLNGTVDAGQQGAAGVSHAIDVTKGATDQNTAVDALTWGHEAQAAHNYATGLQGLSQTTAQQFQQDRANHATSDAHDLQMKIAEAIGGAGQMQHESDVADRTYNEQVRQFNEQQALAKQTELDSFGSGMAKASATATAATTRASAAVKAAQVRAAASKAAAAAKAAGKSKADQAAAAARAAAATSKHHESISKQATGILARYNTKPKPFKDTRKIDGTTGKRIGPKPKQPKGPKPLKDWYGAWDVLRKGGMSNEDAAYMASQQFPDASQSQRIYTDNTTHVQWQYNPTTGKFEPRRQGPTLGEHA